MRTIVNKIAYHVYNFSMKIKFPERLRELRKEKGITQKELAEQMNVAVSTVTRWELDVQEPDYLTLAKLAMYFGVSSDYLLGLED